MRWRESLRTMDTHYLGTVKGSISQNAETQRLSEGRSRPGDSRRMYLSDHGKKGTWRGTHRLENLVWDGRKRPSGEHSLSGDAKGVIFQNEKT